MDVRSDASRYGAAEPSSISSTLLDQIRRSARGLAAAGQSLWAGGLSLVPANGRGPRDAADVVQEVFAAVAAGAGRFRRETLEQSFGAWLRTVTRSKVCDHFRRRRGLLDAEGGTDAQQRLLNLPALADESDSLSASLTPDSRFVHRALEVVRAEFEPRTWDAFWRVAVDGQSPAETAEAMRLSLAAVYQAKSRVLRRLRRELKDLSE